MLKSSVSSNSYVLRNRLHTESHCRFCNVAIVYCAGQRIWEISLAKAFSHYYLPSVNLYLGMLRIESGTSHRLSRGSTLTPYLEVWGSLILCQDLGPPSLGQSGDLLWLAAPLKALSLSHHPLPENLRRELAQDGTLDH